MEFPMRVLFALSFLACKGDPQATATPPTDTDLPVPTPTCDDAQEPNEDRASAIPITDGVRAVLRAESDDHWSFPVPPGQRAAVTVANDSLDANVDADLLLASGAVLDSAETPGSDDEQLTGANLTETEQIFVLHTWLAGAEPGTCADYGVTLDIGCTDDGDLPNDRNGALELDVGDEVRGQVAGADWDWFAIEVDGGHRDTFQIRFPAAAGALDWEVWLEDFPDQFLQDGTADAGFPLALDNADTSPLTFLVGLKHATGGCNLYDLVVED